MANWKLEDNLNDWVKSEFTTKMILAKLSKRNCLLSGIRYLSTEKEAESLRIQQNQCFQS